MAGFRTLIPFVIAASAALAPTAHASSGGGATVTASPKMSASSIVVRKITCLNGCSSIAYAQPGSTLRFQGPRLDKGKRVVYLAPIKALAEEKYADFREKYDAYGMKVIVSTRDRREFDADLESGSFSIAVVVYEKLEQLLVRRPERIAQLALVDVLATGFTLRRGMKFRENLKKVKEGLRESRFDTPHSS